MKHNFSGKAGYAGVFLVGVAFAAGWSPCIGPVLAGTLTLSASGGSALDAAVLLGAYCAGLAIPFLAAAFALDRFVAWSAGLRRSAASGGGTGQRRPRGGRRAVAPHWRVTRLAAWLG